jgi:putative DNA primase/helicase
MRVVATTTNHPQTKKRMTKAMADIIRASLPGNRSEDDRPASGNNVIPFPRDWQASCDELPIWWDAEQVENYIASREQASLSMARAEEYRGHFGMAGDMPEQCFRDFARDNGVTLPDKLVHGTLHRFDPDDGGRRSDKGWCVFRGDFGIVGVWGTDIEEGVKWCAKKANGEDLTEAERQEQKKKADASKRQYEREKQRQHEEAAKKARDILDAATPALDSHPYLIYKCIRAYGLQLHEDKLVMPLQDEHGVIWSYQFITEEGDKRFPFGARKIGLCYIIGGPIGLDFAGVIYIAEGFATAATIHAATGAPCIVAIDCGNLLPVAKAWRAVRKKASFVICADSDAWTGHGGEKKAIEAAAAIDALVAVPVFTTPRTYGKSDFNDLAKFESLEAVKRCLADAKRQNQDPKSPNARLSSKPLSNDWHP